MNIVSTEPPLSIFEPQLTEHELAAAVGLDVHLVRRYCQIFAANLESQGSGADQRWAPICAQTLRLIDQLYQYGQDTTTIRSLFNASAGSPSSSPPAPDPSPSAATDRPQQLSPGPEITWAQWSRLRPQGTWSGLPSRPEPWRRRLWQ